MVNKTALVLSFLAVITLGGVTNKFAYQIKDVGDPAYPAHFFKKPWFLELLMFIGMTLSFPLHWAVQSFSKPKIADGTASESLLPEEVGDRGWKVRALIFLPAMGDLVGSILSFTGLVYISNSTAQMLGSSIIIMVALNSYIFLGRRYNRIQYLGMGIVLASLLVVGYSADMAARDKTVSTGMQEYSASQQAFGMFLCVLARVVNSIQFVLEEKVMGESGFHPFEVTGTEGVYGLIMTACVIMPTLAVIPGSDVGGVFENTKDSLLMIQRNSTLDLVLIFYLLGLWGLNALGMMVMKHLGSVFRAVSRNMQALFVWLIDMALFYGLGQRGFGYGPVGEPWQGTASWIQVIGFIFMTVGVFVYAYGNAEQQVMAAQALLASSLRRLSNLSRVRPCAMLSQLAVLAVLFASGDCFRASTDLKDQECQESQTNPEYFSELRSNAFITECSKKDVCLLMRQLDAYFYARALKGELVDYGKPPGGRFLASGNCKRPLNSKKLVPVTTKEECQKILSKHTKKKMKVIHSTKYPAGCIMDFVTKRGRFNKADTNVDAGVKYIRVGKSRISAQRKKTDVRQYCYDDYALDEAAASYYSPYKLKASMAGRPEMSTSCSFGMMAGLSRVGLTDSPCASILVGEQGTKAKNVLIEQITNHWCPGIWHEAMDKGATCSADRFPSWAKHGFVQDEDEEGIVERAEYLVRGIGGETKEDLMDSRTAKMGLPEGVCENIEDELFDGILSGKGDEAPDFFRDAMVK